MSPPAPETTGRAALLGALEAALARVDAEAAVLRAFDEVGRGDPAARFDEAGAGRVHVLALGKAAVPMARAAQRRLGEAAAGGLVVTKDGHADAFAHWPVLETAHPVPDARSAAAGRRVLELAARVPPRDRLLVLLSGGTSALVAAPVEGLRPDDLAATNALLLASGAPIGETNVVRKRLARVSAGRLAAATAARRIDVWIVSDVVGDDPASIASGPCHPDPSDFEAALEIVRRRGVLEALPPRVRAHLESGAAAGRRDAPMPGDAVFSRVHTRLVARSRDAVEAAATSLRAAGARALVLGDRMTGEARRRGAQVGGLARAIAQDARRGSPVALAIGGETTVRLGAEPGRGGRNQELALAAALALAGGPGGSAGAKPPGASVLAAGTDGTDGPTDAAGGLVDDGSCARMRAAGIEPERALEGHDAGPALEAAGDLVRTGPTGTNVMDLTLVWIDASG